MEDVRLPFPFMAGMDSTSHPAMADNSTLETDTQNIFMQKAETYMAFRVAAYITNYWVPILPPLGLVGNSLSFLVMMRSNK